MTKKITSILLSLVLLCGTLSLTAFAKTSEEADTHLQFNEDGTFKIMQVADLQDKYPMKLAAKELLRAEIEQLQPDLIVLTGDNIGASTNVKLTAKLAINEFMSIFEEYGVPVAMTYGNHDDEKTTATKSYQLSVYESYDCFIGCAGEDFGNSTLCTYYIPIYSSADADKQVFNVWITDSGTYNNENDLGGYGCVTKEQIEWYKAASEKLEAENGAKIPSVMFQHIIIPEIYDALTEVEEGTPGAVSRDGKYYVLPENATGFLNEAPCPPNYSNGQFDAVVERGDVIGMFFGHDHINSFQLNYNGIGLVNTQCGGFRSYNNELVGCRLIAINEDDPWTFETQAYSYFDIFDYEDDAARYLYKMYAKSSSDATKFACFFKYIFAVLKSMAA